jgi:23S rRNA (uracil1939-C5)-methyltransferase
VANTPENPEILTLKIHDLARGGAGVSRDVSGRIVFVPFTAPGDEVRVKIVQAKKNYAMGELLEVVTPSAERQKPPCPVFGRCGGCQWQHLPYGLQWKTKVQGVTQALKRVQLELPSHLDELPAEQIWEYRNRVQLRGFKSELGFHAAGSNDLVAVDHCPIARPEINLAWEETRAEGERLGTPFKVEVEVLEDGSIRRTWNARHGAQGFRQVHDEQNERLKQWVAQALTPGRSVLDLFGGSGNLSLGLASRMTEVHCVDIGAPGGIEGNVHFHREAVLPWIVKKATRIPMPRFDSAILDPPREGLGGNFDAIVESLETLGVSEIIAVGCDPDSWARDVSRFVLRGWRLERAAIVDLFPQTAHVESIARLSIGL